MNTSGIPKRLLKLGVTSVITIVIFLGTTKATYANEYLFKVGGNNTYTNAQIIPEPQYQHYLYAKMPASQEVIDYYTLDFTDYTAQVIIELLVPKSTGKEDFHPQLIFSDPLNKRTEGAIPFNYPPHLPGRVFTWTEKSAQVTTDSRTGEQFWVGPSFVKDMAPNKYMVAVYDPAGAGGTYALRMGATPKSQTWQDKLLFLWSWVRIKLQLY